MSEEFVVYIIRYHVNHIYKYYTGYTGNIKRRTSEHRKGIGAKCLRGHKLYGYAIAIHCRSRSDAMREERRIKRLSHLDKEEIYYKKRVEDWE